ncbi:MAG: DUF2330 domain-containing protein [Anaerolineae bacterium]
MKPTAVLRITFLFGAIILALLAAPAEACGCGGYVPREGDAHVTQERALLRWDGQTEDIVMAFNVQGSSDEAALIMPVPARASVKLADPKLFDTLQELTKPLVEKRPRAPSFGLGAGAPEAVGGAAPPVTLLDRQTLGPFDVSTLTATDSTALVDWLKTNGYNMRPQLAQALQPYVDQQWYYVAVRLTPGQSGDKLKGSLDPIWISFPAQQLVYPMRASAAATIPLPVILYVLAPHRVTKSASFGPSHLAYAGWVDPGTAGVTPALAPFVGSKMFLTKYQDTAFPSQINADYVFAQAPTDETYRDTQIEYVDDPSVYLVPLLLCGVMALAALAVLLAVVIFAVRRLRKPEPA